MLEKILIFVIFLCPLIFFHELGHFLFARLFGVRVEVFSLGFGPKIFKWRRKEKDTEYALSLIPLGGYVKMFGDDPLGGDQIKEEDKPFAFTHKNKWARFWIVFGGPLANFILAFVLFFALAMVGEKVPEAKFGIVKEGTSFYKTGIHTGDVIVAINGEEIAGISDLTMEGNKIDKISVKRGEEKFDFVIDKPFKDFVEEFMLLSPRFRSPVVVNDRGEKFVLSKFTNNYENRISLDEMAESTLGEIYAHRLVKFEKIEDIKVENYAAARKLKLETKNSIDFFSKLRTAGFYPLDLSISSIVMGSPADKAKLKQGDIILTTNSQAYSSFEEMREAIQQIKKDQKVDLQVLRGQEKIVFQLIPEAKEINGEKMLSIGVYSAGDYIQPVFVQNQGKNIFTSFMIGIDRTWDAIIKTIDGFKKLIMNEVSIKNIGGPLAIGKVAADSLNISLSYFFRLMALISVNLGVINLFPIPVLDGGHIMFLIFEFVNRGPLSRKKMQIAQQFGVSLLFLLIFVALFNDISRLF